MNIYIYVCMYVCRCYRPSSRGPNESEEITPNKVRSLNDFGSIL